MSDYQLPEVWEAPNQMGGAWGGLNQPTAGARFEQTLPKGDQPFQLYTLPTPNGIKTTIMLEELKELGVDAGFWQTGAAPFLGGGFGHFLHYAPEKIEYDINRFAMEAIRQLDLLDKELATKPYIAGDDYTIADIAIWSWYGRLAQDKIWDRAGVFLDVKEYKHLQAWTEKIANRPAVKRGLEVEYKEIDA